METFFSHPSHKYVILDSSSQMPFISTFTTIQSILPSKCLLNLSLLLIFTAIHLVKFFVMFCLGYSNNLLTYFQNTTLNPLQFILKYKSDHVTLLLNILQ